MCLFDLIEEDNGVGLSADFLRQLAGFIITHIARRRTDQLGDRVLFHKLGHIQADQRVHRIKQIVCQALDQFRLTHTGGTDKDERHRAALGTNTHTVTADCLCNGLHRLILAHNMLFQAVSQTLDLLVLLGLDLGCGNLGPQFDNTGKIFHGHCGSRYLFQLLNFVCQVAQTAADHSQALIMLIFRIFCEHPQFQFIIVPFFLQFRQA